jgi:hypothetical protein
MWVFFGQIRILERDMAVHGATFSLGVKLESELKQILQDLRI